MSGSLASARCVVPLVLDMLTPRPASVADVGCGVGPWLSVVMEHGITDVAGFDGSYVPRELLMIPRERFVEADLTRPVAADRAYDLALCLEVGEHLPAVAGPTLVASLTRLAPVILFSAAVPFQGGTGHINERWPDFWAGLFAAHDYLPVDAVRPRIWRQREVALWYRQNLMLYAHRDKIAADAGLAAARARTNDAMLSIAHPELFEKRNRKPIRRFPRLARARAWVSGLLGTLRGRG